MFGMNYLTSEFNRVFNTSPPVDLFRMQNSACELENSEFKESLMERFYRKTWQKVTLDDWINTADPAVVFVTLNPGAFFYYLPSLLLASVENTNYLDWGLRAILPSRMGDSRIGGSISGRDWRSYHGLFSGDQRKAVVSYTKYSKRFVNVGSSDFYFNKYACEIWRDDPSVNEG